VELPREGMLYETGVGEGEGGGWRSVRTVHTDPAAGAFRVITAAGGTFGRDLLRGRVLETARARGGCG